MNPNFVTQIGDVVLLDNDETFCIAKQVLHEDERFLIAKKITADIAGLFDIENPNLKVFKEIVENNECSFELITDKDLVKALFQEAFGK